MVLGRREMLLVAFMQASNCSNYTGGWSEEEAILKHLNTT